MMHGQKNIKLLTVLFTVGTEQNMQPNPLYFAITFMLSRTVSISDPCCDASRYFEVPVIIIHHMYDVKRQ
jgi:hypothetical protein